jgi:fatty-acyl-CoA synthase
VPDEEWGEVGKAFVVPSSDAAPDHEELRDFLSARVARYKVPKLLELGATLPRTASGKVQKAELRRNDRADPVHRLPLE